MVASAILREVRRCLFDMIFVLALSGAAWAESVDVSGQPVYVTRNDCAALTKYHQPPGVAYQPGVDVHGKSVAPADLDSGTQNLNLGHDRVQFNLQINPLTYGANTSTLGGNQARFGNTAMPVARVTVDLKTGETLINGQPLDGQQDRIVLEACRKAGIH
jgi:hypothetical protein